MKDWEIWESLKKSVKPLAKKQVVQHLIKHKFIIKNDTRPYCLDLHGYTIQEAYNKLKDFIVYHKDNKTKYITIITGKGSLDKESLIHSEIENWISNPFFKNYIKTFEWINGNGALRIYLVRQ